MKKIFLALKRHDYFTNHCTLFIILALCLNGCRPMGDELVSYGQNDTQAFYEANYSFAEEFKTFWLAMNENYCIWDFEEEYGVDWDAVYETYLPHFEALDDTTRQDKVTDEELTALYQEFTDSLHDGHMALLVRNLHSGKYIVLQPNNNRLQRERKEQYVAETNNVTNLNLYRTTAVNAAYRIQDYDETGNTLIVPEFIDTMLQRVLRAMDQYIALVDSNGGPNQTNKYIYAVAGEMKAAAQTILLHAKQSSSPSMVSFIAQEYNAFCTQYAVVSKQFGVKLQQVDSKVASDGLGYIRYALFEGNIAYLRLGGFSLTPHLEPNSRSTDKYSQYYAYQVAVERVWRKWFNAIQSLHKAGSLGGVIIDVRNNGGGYVNDYKFCLGSLLPSGGFASHTMRMKNGTGRLDYGPLSPFVMPTYEEEHEVINDRPIVVLANCRSVSLAENTTWGVKSQPNGCFIGTRTYGGLNALNTDPAYYSETYSGAFGVQNVTPIYGYLPKYVCLYGEELKPVEGIGFYPDIETPLDVNRWMTTKQDNQLEKAIDYIRGR